MWKIIAIGWWKIGQQKKEGWYFPVQIELINREIIKLSWVKNPRLLFIPTASSDWGTDIVAAKNHFSQLGCQVNVLYLISKEILPASEIRERILSSDIVYVWWWNTLKMMTIWRKLWIDSILKEAYEKWVVLSGLSAGAICWFEFGNSDSRKFTSGSDQLIKVRWLGLVPGLLCPHYDTEISRQKDLPRMMKFAPWMIAIALDECCAIEIVDGKYRLITSRETASWYKIYWKWWKYFQEKIPIQETLLDLQLLLSIH